jgi:outer membrane protein, adhesin transport system
MDVVRYLRLVAIAEQNVANHEKIFANVNSRFSGGRAGEGDLDQARERVENAHASLAEFRKSLEDARAAYRKTVGLEPINLRFPGPLRGMPSSRDEALAVAIRFNPTILAAEADRDAARHAFRTTDGSFLPKFWLEGSATHYDNTYPYIGVTNDQYAGKVVMSWDIFRGGQDAWRRSEMAERYTEATMRHARLQRGAVESIDKAWGARTVTATRIAALVRQLEAARKTIAAFQKEYELGQRSLIDLLNAQNQYFNAQVSLTSSRSVVVFADYQLLAAMGTLLEYLRSPPPVDAAPVDLVVFGWLPAYNAPTFRWRSPQTGSEPLRVPVPAASAAPAPLTAMASAEAQPQPEQAQAPSFKDRWPQSSFTAAPSGVAEWFAQKKPAKEPLPLDPNATGQASSYAATDKPHWLLTAFPPQPR